MRRGVDVLPARLALAIRSVQTGNDLRSAAARERRAGRASEGHSQTVRKSAGVRKPDRLASDLVFDLFELSIESVAGDPEHRSRPSSVAVAEAKSLLNRRAFQALHRERLLPDMTLVR